MLHAEVMDRELSFAHKMSYRLSGNDYTMRFIGCDSIQSRSFVSDGFETKTMTQLELKRIGHINCIV